MALANLWRQWFYPVGDTVWEIAQLEDGAQLWVNACEIEGGNLLFGVSFEPSEMVVVKHLVGPGDIFVDVGANIGVYTILASRLVGISGRVYAFEPIQSVFEYLERNISLNKATNVIVNRIALEEKDREAEIFVNRESGLTSLGQTGRGYVIATEMVSTMPLDQYLESRSVPRVDFLKIDVEGYEGHVLRGASRLLEREHRLVVLCELAEKNFKPLGLSVGSVIDWMRGYGFEAWEINRHDGQLFKIESSQALFTNQNFVFAHPGTDRSRILMNLVANANL